MGENGITAIYSTAIYSEAADMSPEADQCA